MRLAALSLFFGFAIAASAQDASQMAIQQAQMANQIAIQQMQQANQQAIQQSQQATQQMQQSMDQAAQNASCCGASFASAPSFSIKPGSYTAPATLRLRDRARGAVIYYTIDGWTPTAQSTRYTGPITISSTTQVQAIAIAPGYLPSMVATGTFSFPAATSSATPAPAPGTALLTFTAPVTSKGAQVGDTLPVALAEDLTVGALVVPKGTPALATVTGVDGPGAGGAPGRLSFAVHSIQFNGQTIRLDAEETKQGEYKVKHALSLVFIPVVGVPAALLVHGGEATIPAGATLVASVDPKH